MQWLWRVDAGSSKRGWLGAAGSLPLTSAHQSRPDPLPGHGPAPRLPGCLPPVGANWGTLAPATVKKNNSNPINCTKIQMQAGQRQHQHRAGGTLQTFCEKAKGCGAPGLLRCSWVLQEPCRGGGTCSNGPMRGAAWEQGAAQLLQLLQPSHRWQPRGSGQGGCCTRKASKAAYNLAGTSLPAFPVLMSRVSG